MPDNPPVTPEQVDWRAHVPEDVKGDVTLAKIVENIPEKDLPSLIKSHVHLTKRMGSSVTLPTKNPVSGYKPEEVQAVRTKMYEAGIFEAPPADPKDYGVTKPIVLPDGIGWSDDLAGKFSSLLHKHSAPKGMAKDLMDLYADALIGTQRTLQTSVEEGRKALEKEWGADYQAKIEGAERLAQHIFSSDEEVEFFKQTGILQHPMFLRVLGTLAPLAEQDSSFFKDAGRLGGSMSGDDVRSELAKIMSDKTHPDYDGYRRQDPKVMAKVADMYKRVYGAGIVPIGAGIKVEGKPA